ncbi:MAG: ABC transporter ATP-binding protein [Clostridia bacterium]|nr:ABC transporter ATP-binding protein [Clostridia bacterium]
MIDINQATMDFRREHDNTNSLKEFFVKLLQGKLHYEKFRAVDNVTAQIKKGQVCGIIGRNGAGKSTLLKMIAGVLKPTDGSIRIHGNIAPMLELGAGFDQDLTAKENIYLNGAILGYSRDFINKRFDDIVEFAELREFIDQPVRTFSSGMMMRLAFSIATQVDPEILIVDEILSVGDSHFRQKSEGRMREMMSGGTTVLMVSHVLGQIRSMCDRVIWLDHGKVVMDGDAKTVCDAYEGLIDFDNAPKFEIGRHMDDIQRVNMYPDNWLPPQGSYKIKTGPMGLVSGNLRCPFNDLTGKERISISLDCNGEEEPVVIHVSEEHMSFEIKGAPDTVVTVQINSNFSRSPGQEQRKLSLVLEDTDGN